MCLGPLFTSEGLPNAVIMQLALLEGHVFTRETLETSRNFVICDEHVDRIMRQKSFIYIYIYLSL